MQAVLEGADARAVPVGMYAEVPDDQGGSARFSDVPEVVRVAAPVYLELRVRRAQLVLRLLGGQGTGDLAVPA